MENPTQNDPPVASTDLFGSLGPMASAKSFAECLVRHNIVSAYALDDPEGYDGHQTLDLIGGAYDEITEHLRARAESAMRKLKDLIGDIQSLPNDERMHPYRRRRASITRLRL